MRLIVLLIVIGGSMYFLWTYFGAYQTNVESNVDAPEGLQNGILAPIESAENVRDMVESRY